MNVEFAEMRAEFVDFLIAFLTWPVPTDLHFHHVHLEEEKRIMNMNLKTLQNKTDLDNWYDIGYPKLFIQLWTFAIIRLLNKPYENEVTLIR